ncbi:MAG TPA: DAK2 domain-containing protein, partial [Dehalococcoidales bacterium]|nr:DAK2 domain-containing protein [Dehalococcoidales bacterium]
ILLPNNKNIIMTAKQVHGLTKKKVHVLPSKTVPQGVAAILAFDYEADIETNLGTMEKACKSVRSVEITRAIRTTKFEDMRIRKNQAIGLLDTDLVAVANTAPEVLNKVLGVLDLDDSEIMTVYYGQGVKKEDADAMAAAIREEYSNLQVEVVKGDQPHYEYIISIE